jgi:hypothetical protein
MPWHVILNDAAVFGVPLPHLLLTAPLGMIHFDVLFNHSGYREPEYLVAARVEMPVEFPEQVVTRLVSRDSQCLPFRGDID